jgi:ubiquinone/menaquinone biosynthesis C-methylase UbiE
MFRKDLYQGSARCYDRFRIPYPPALIDDLVARAEASGEGRLMDLGCGTGQISFAMHGWFQEIWAVDQESDMIGVGREKAERAGIGNIRFFTSSAEDLSAPEGYFDLVAIGNAFHRFHRETVARDTSRWLRPGGYLALLWGDTPWIGEALWQKAMWSTCTHWMITMNVGDRIPTGWDEPLVEKPDITVFEKSGFNLVGHYQFSLEHQWTLDELIGFVHSTSFLPLTVLGDSADEFEEDLRGQLGLLGDPGQLLQSVGFAYQLFRNPI